MSEKDFCAGLIGQAIPEVVETEPRLNKEIERVRFVMPLLFSGVDVILFRETIPVAPPVTQWIAACRDYYVVAQGRTQAQALTAWKSTFIADVLMFMASGCERHATPADHWAEMSAKAEESHRLAFTLVGSHGTGSVSEASGSAQSAAQKGSSV